MDPTALVEMGSNGVLVAIVLAAFKALETRSAKKNGGTVYARVAVLEAKVTELTGEIERLYDKIGAFHRDFCIHRENVRLHWARSEGAKEALASRERDTTDG